MPNLPAASKARAKAGRGRGEGRQQELLPVLVFIHGGSNVFGHVCQSGRSAGAGGDDNTIEV